MNYRIECYLASARAKRSKEQTYTRRCSDMGDLPRCFQVACQISLIFHITIVFVARLEGETINRPFYFLLIYGITSLILTMLVNTGILYVTIDAVVSFWSYIFFVFNPIPMLYRSALVVQHGPSVWINSTTMTAILFIYPIMVIAVATSLILFYRLRGGLICGKKGNSQE